jgi:hypothetical protein
MAGSEYSATNQDNWIGRAAQAQPFIGGLPSGGVNCTQPPKEPSLHARALEALKYLDEASRTTENLRGRILGFGPECNGEGMKECAEPSLDRLLALISQRAALLVGELSTLNNKIG